MAFALPRALTRAARASAAAPALPSRFFSSSARALGPAYTAHAVASGAGRNGEVKLTSGKDLSLKLAMPKELGGDGNGHNPEQLFSSGYASCFLSALQLVARESKVKIPEDIAINADVTIAKSDDGFGLSVVLTGKSSKLEKSELEKLMHEAHKVCPYSKATRGNIPVELKVA
ncbi:hypothetical protein OC834_000005 [Tilletia horrida]|uniref:Organic hydroperoxide resistance protein n=1 Tax=Tilletia horrida TaxID=155126 RepID=A0AAN6G9A2_9BASI|nr:hypothetical protein OC842_005860 [Tilletia horrida]KAK0534652.1 hypothetical protein OC835_002613 [Tilletia horrida]KAK0539450.1 hypothetical protein OC834_000005 [Tilletia horrida]KAK0567493.1 hypothetical protein OC844_000184 [Tilletia horrida]